MEIKEGFEWKPLGQEWARQKRRKGPRVEAGGIYRLSKGGGAIKRHQEKAFREAGRKLTTGYQSFWKRESERISNCFVLTRSCEEWRWMLTTGFGNGGGQ